ncbi:hypothetical protein [Alicyclobacillus sp. SO9]|uniref:hypothetical protein n=1 Tax=Alicyclobacillus sp. SO9 TaxID=2665646 RepID=UPI001937057A|nr:hypothetical protein [Alicyclobacillus sp. SO9]QQE78661.1 hypothetical protein GI364_22865 [Alicyclobacillus sp. SO9]
MRMKKLFMWSVFSLSVLAMLVPSTAYASPSSSSTFSAPKRLTRVQVEHLQQSGVTPNPVTHSLNRFSPMFAVPAPGGANSYWYHFASMNPYSFITTESSKDFVIGNTEPVTIQLVQYPATSGSINLAYTLYPVGNGYASETIHVTKRFTSTDDWITFPNVQPGTYYLEVDNLGSAYMDGNGIVYW